MEKVKAHEKYLNEDIKNLRADMLKVQESIRRRKKMIDALKLREERLCKQLSDFESQTVSNERSAISMKTRIEHEKSQYQRIRLKIIKIVDC